MEPGVPATLVVKYKWFLHAMGEQAHRRNTSSEPSPELDTVCLKRHPLEVLFVISSKTEQYAIPVEIAEDEKISRVSLASPKPDVALGLDLDRMFGVAVRVNDGC